MRDIVQKQRFFEHTIPCTYRDEEYGLVTCNVDARYCSPRRIDRLRQRVSDPGIFSL